MQIDYINGQFVASCTYEERLEFKRAGWRFSPAIRKWTTDSPNLADKFSDFATPEALSVIATASARLLKAVEASRAIDCDDEFWCPEGKEYKKFQKAGIRFMLDRPDTLMADAPGVGKTIQSIAVASNMPSLKKVLIVVPSFLRYNWERELRIWLHPRFKVGFAESKIVTHKIIVGGKTKYKPETVHEWPQGVDVVVTTYGMLENFHDQLREFNWDLVIFDEAHYLSNPKTIRSKHVFGGGRGKKAITAIPRSRSIYITGTPILSKPIDLWPFVKVCDPKGLGASYLRFVYRYCNAHETYFGLDTTGASNLEELQEKLRSTFMIRRLKSEVLHELPPKTRIVTVLPAEGLKKIVKKELTFFVNNLDALAQFNGHEAEITEEATFDAIQKFVSDAIDKAVDFKDLETGVVDLEEYLKLHFSAMAAAKEEIGLAKVPMVVEYVNTLKAQGVRKIVIMAEHKAVVRELLKFFPNAAVATGDVTAKKRQKAVDRFQDDETCEEFIGTIAASGVGYTLTEASHMVLAEFNWVASIMEQAEDRIHRIGQLDGAMIHYLVVVGSIESRIVNKIIEKIEIAEKALNAQNS